MAESVRERLESIGTVADSSGIKLSRPDAPPIRLARSYWSRLRELWIAGMICLPFLLFGLWQVRQHTQKSSCVMAARRAGLISRLELQPFPGALGFLNTPYFRYLFGNERAIVELNNEKDLAMLLLSDVEKGAPVNLYVYFDLTATQRNSLWPRLYQAEVVRLAR